MCTHVRVENQKIHKIVKQQRSRQEKFRGKDSGKILLQRLNKIKQKRRHQIGDLSLTLLDHPLFPASQPPALFTCASNNHMTEQDGNNLHKYGFPPSKLVP